MPLNMALVQSNYRGVTKKMTMTALLFLAYCGGNVAGPQFFRREEAPRYETAFRTIMVCYGLAICAAVGLRVYLGWVNARRVREEGLEGSAGSAGVQQPGTSRNDVENEILSRSTDLEDATDWNTVGFRYRL